MIIDIELDATEVATNAKVSVAGRVKFAIQNLKHCDSSKAAIVAALRETADKLEALPD